MLSYLWLFVGFLHQDYYRWIIGLLQKFARCLIFLRNLLRLMTSSWSFFVPLPWSAFQNHCVALLFSRLTFSRDLQTLSRYFWFTGTSDEPAHLLFDLAAYCFHRSIGWHWGSFSKGQEHFTWGYLPSPLFGQARAHYVHRRCTWHIQYVYMFCKSTQ